MFVGTSNGTILIIQNEVIKNQFDGCNGARVASTFILFDQYGYMTTSCENPTNKLYLYTQDGSYTGTSLSTPLNPRYIGFDKKGFFFVTSRFQISVFN
jgi:hypothetical protein